ncbi:NADP-dependent oxidoreductase [Cnuibacter physcomitrellae]|uniref:NADP-dependent oxidoreductase n=1 Tax=Cnuibacter physcomitrellae TaxID=1619308 RepID=UPI0021759192|nr:NADP-dependent oxidoreductase [Cnuibacter physcomitrellae]MCS5497142.1 NADP-dependent oxidoreductase [Cnuibacter physcomitrellae]
MTETMRAIVQDELGGPEVLHVAEVERPTPSLGRVLVRVHAAGVNPADEMNRRTGTFSGVPPFTLGWDVSGVVEAVGPGVTLYRPGDEVFGLLPFPSGSGAYAEYVVAPTRVLVPKPASLSHVQAAALPLAGLTAWQALAETARLTSGERVLITGATGGVGHLAVQIAAAAGAEVIGLASTENLDLARDLGATTVLDYRGDDVLAGLRELDVVFDTVGRYAAEAVPTIRSGGTLISTLPQTLGDAVQKGAEHGIRVAGLFVESDRLGLNALVDLVEAGRLRPLIAATYPLDEAAAAHAEPHGPGKVVLMVRPTVD